jgi:NCS1 family nucleobase:cation symporter-1
VYSLGWVLGCTISSVLYFALCMLGDFCREERAMKFEESYEIQGMFLGDGAGAVEGVEVGAKDAGEGEKGVGESKVREV